MKIIPVLKPFGACIITVRSAPPTRPNTIIAEVHNDQFELFPVVEEWVDDPELGLKQDKNETE